MVFPYFPIFSHIFLWFSHHFPIGWVPQILSGPALPIWPPQVRVLFEALEIGATDAWSLFLSLDHNEDYQHLGGLSAEWFVWWVVWNIFDVAMYWE